MRAVDLITVPALLLALLLVGCGSEPKGPANRAVVTGTVTFNGEPLPGGTITFMSEGNANIRVPVTIYDGNYESPRVPIGKCKVYVETESLNLGNPAAYRKIPAKYERADTSGFTAEIQPGDNEGVDFELKS